VHLDKPNIQAGIIMKTHSHRIGLANLVALLLMVSLAGHSYGQQVKKADPGPSPLQPSF